MHAKEYYGTFKGIIDPGTSDDKIQKGNTKAQVVDDDDTGPEGYFFVQTGGTERLRVDKDGNVGIGTTNPDHELQIHGDEPRLRITHDGSTNPLNSFYVRVDSDGVEFDSYQEVTGTRRPFIFTQYQKERLRITEGGGVGIGTTDPNSDMTGKTDTTLAVAGIVTANEYYGEFKGSIDPGVSITNAKNIEITDDTTQSGTHYVHFGSETSGYDNVEVDSEGLTYIDGTVGIGTSLPNLSAKLDVRGELWIGGNTEPVLRWRDGSNEYATARVRNGSLAFETRYNGTDYERLRIGPQGQLGLGGANYGSEEQVLTSQGSNKPPVWTSKASGDLTEIDVIQENYCNVEDTPLNPITVTQASAGITTVSIATTSNAYGRKYVQDNDPTTSSGGNYVVCDGDIWYDTDGDVPGGTMPSGSIIMYNGDVAPSGWAICNGQNGTPDLRDKFIVSTGSSYNRGDTGGAESVTLTKDQIPSHDHNVDVLAEFGSTHGTWSTGSGYRQVHTLGTHNKPITSDTGGGQSHENRPPYYALTFIMKL